MENAKKTNINIHFFSIHNTVLLKKLVDYYFTIT